MNEDSNVANDSTVNQTESANYSYQFDPNASPEEDDYIGEKDREDPNAPHEGDKEAPIGGYQLNRGKRLCLGKTNSPSSSFAKEPYGNGIRGRIGSIGGSNGYWGRGAISVLGIAIILGILVLVITFLAK